MELCILIPAKNEELVLSETIDMIQQELTSKIPFNILVINDHSDDKTTEILSQLSSHYSNVNYVSNSLNAGVGNAIRFGLSQWKGDVVGICMADGSDNPLDLLQSYNYINDEGFDCVFGSRFVQGGEIKNYPLLKLLLNRVFNIMVRMISGIQYNDFTNHFKVYHRRAINQIEPLEAAGFSIGLEMSLKAFKRKCKIMVIPISWRQREMGVSKLSLVKNLRGYLVTLRNSI
jgi:dolichol-phosphate mannosyltransferase